MKKNIAFCMCLLIVCSSFAACGKSSKKDSVEVAASQKETVFSTTQQVQSSVTKTTVVSTKMQSQPTQTTQTSVVEKDDLNVVQKNSIAWLNYLAMLTQEINASKNSRMYLEEAYSALMNNTNPENVNERTEEYLVNVLGFIDSYRFVEQKRERLQYIYEQNQARAIKEAVPDPVAFLSATVSFDLKKIAASVLYMAVDSYSSYKAYNNEIDQAYLKEGWELDDETDKILSRSRSHMFTYMIDIVQENNVPGILTLSEDTVKDFVDCKNNKNVNQQLQFLESHQETYQAFGEYWLLLAECYYNNEQYQKCLDSVSEYEELNLNIFRKDYDFAKVLPLAIVAASKIQSQNEYVQTAEKYLDMLIQNTKEEKWSLCYFAATTYIDLYQKTHNEKYIKQAYSILVDNINYLTNKQQDMNRAYFADVEEIPIPDDVTKDEKKKIKAYNKEQKKNRKTELPEIYEPLALNCDLLFSIADQVHLSQDEKDRVDGILYGGDYPAFLTEPLQNLFSFERNEVDTDISAVFDKDVLTLPVSCVSEDTVIKVTVSNENQSVVYDDWKIDVVERPKNDSEDIADFKAVYTSEKAKDCKWSKNSIVTVEISNGKYSSSKPLVIHFKVSDFKARKILWDTVEFEQV